MGPAAAEENKIEVEFDDSIRVPEFHIGTRTGDLTKAWEIIPYKKEKTMISYSERKLLFMKVR